MVPRRRRLRAGRPARALGPGALRRHRAADSFIVDPHKWLFGPLDCCALVYREPARARAVHTQHAPYLEALHVDDAWNPADLAFHLTRRTRGLPVWFSLATHGVAAYRAAIQRGLDLARAAADRVRALGPPVELVMEPTLSVVLFRRVGWTEDDWYAGRAGCSTTAWPS